MITISIPFHLRGNATNIAYYYAFRHYAALPYTVHLCGSEGELSEAFAAQFLNDTTTYHEVPQSELVTVTNGHPVLLKKFNDSLRTLPDSEWKCLIGADDIVSPDFFTHLLSIKIEEAALAGIRVRELYYLHDLSNKETRRVSITGIEGQRLSSGVSALNKSAMKINGGDVFYAEGSEIGLEKEMQKYGNVIALSGWVINVKGNDSLHSFEICRRYNETFPIHNFEKSFVKSIIDEA